MLLNEEMATDLAIYDEPAIDYDQPPPTLDGMDQAERFLRRIRALEAKQDEIESFAQAEIDRIRAWAIERAGVLARAAAHLSTSVEQFMRAHHAATGTVTLKLPHGELRLRPTWYSIVARDPDAFVSWAQEHWPEALRVPTPPSPKPDARKVTAAIGERVTARQVDQDGRDLFFDLLTDDGEIVPGIIVKRDVNDRVFTIGKAADGDA